MQVANIAVWDLETGGLQKEKDAVCEIAIVILNTETLEIIDEYEAIIAPYELPDKTPVNYNPKALEVNGLTMSQINAGKPAKQVAQEIVAFCKKHKKNIRGNAGKLVPAGHNIDEFDIPYLTFFLSVFNINYSDLFQKSSIDTMTWTRQKYPVDGSIVDHKLGTSCSKAGIDLFDAHRAMNDVQGNAKLVINYIQCLRGSSEAMSIQSTNQSARDSFRF